MPKQFYYLTESNENVGPVPWDVMLQLLRAGNLTDKTLVAPEGSQNWRRIADVLSEKEEGALSKVTSKAAIWSLILGILSNLFLWFLGSIPAIILGIFAIKNINRNPSAVGGKGLAVAGIFTACTGLIVGVWLYIVIFAIIIAAGTSSIMEANRSKCIIQLTTVQKLVIAHANKHKLKTGDELPAAFLLKEGYITAAPKCPAGGNYTMLGTVPDKKTVYMKCDQEGHVLYHNP